MNYGYLLAIMTTQPNILIYVSDSLRSDHTSVKDYKRDTTPCLEALSQDGYQFREAYSQAIWTSPSSASILTGLYPETHGALSVADQIPDDLVRLPAVLKKAGYNTGLFSTVDQVSKMRNFHIGFDKTDEIFKENDPHETDTAKLSTERFIDWIDSSAEEDPFFGFVWSLGTHNPFFPKSGKFTDESTTISGTISELKNTKIDQSQDVIDLYDDVIHYSDQQFGKIIDYLKSIEKYDDTAIFFLGDHGELLCEHGRLEQVPNWLARAISTIAPSFSSRFRIVDRYGYVGHQAVVPYDELLNVPLVYKPPDSAGDGSNYSELVQTIDVVSTIVDLIPGVDLPVQGKSLLPLIKSGEVINEFTLSDSPTLNGNIRYRSIRTKDYKYIRTEMESISLSDFSTNPERTIFSALRQMAADNEILFECENENQNRINDYPGIVEDMTDLLDSMIQENQREGREFTHATSSVSDEARDRLEQLGYTE